MRHMKIPETLQTMHFLLWLSTSLLFSVKGYHTPSVEGQNVWNGIRIHPVYTESFNAHSLAGVVKKRVIEPALRLWASAVRPKYPISAKFGLSRTCDDHGSVSTSQDILVCNKSCIDAKSCFSHPIPSYLQQECRVFDDGNLTMVAEGGDLLGKFDLIVTFDITQNQHCTGNVAYATSCKLSAFDRRPILGDVVICDSSLQNSSPEFILMKVMIHEVGHVLGFGSALYAYFLDPSTAPNNSLFINGTPGINEITKKSLPSDKVFREVIHHGTALSHAYVMWQFIMVLPSVTDEARNYFNCNSLEGVPLENPKDPSSVGSHFETRILRDDVMSAYFSPDAEISSITLAFMKDTGWYIVNESVAKPMQWGRNAGCDFVKMPCFEIIETRLKAGALLAPFCDAYQFAVPACLENARHFRHCELTPTARSILYRPPNSEKLENVSRLLASVEQCTLLKFAPDARSSFRKADDCQARIDPLHSSETENSALESFGSESICVDHKRQSVWVRKTGNTTFSLGHYGASCHRHVCSADRGLEVLFHNQTTVCPLDGGITPVCISTPDGFLTGSIQCRPCKAICEEDVCNAARQSRPDESEEPKLETCPPFGNPPHSGSSGKHITITLDANINVANNA